jgi:vitamin B12 transporter
MNRQLPLAGLLGLAALGAQAQAPAAFPPTRFDPVLVTATRSLAAIPTLRDAVVITREELEAAGALTLGEVLQRRAGVELRATGGAGQPQGIFIRGAGTGQTLVLIDGMRAGSATVGTTAIEHLPIEMIERIEVVKGPLSSLYGSEAMGGVVQVFTRGKAVPHLFGSAAYGTDNDGRLAAGFTTIEGQSAMSFSAGGRKVDAPSATTSRAFCHDPDRDPYENAFLTMRASTRLWQGETVAIEAFGSRGRTDFDACRPDPPTNAPADRNDQTIAGARITSSTNFAHDWASRLALGTAIDRLEITGSSPSRFETRQIQVAWLNEITLRGANIVGGLEWVRQEVEPVDTFAVNHRETYSAFVGVNQTWGPQRFEWSVRRDDDEAFGGRTTGSLGYGWHWPGFGRLSLTFARGFRAPTFYDLYGPSDDFYQANPALKPERNESREISLSSEPNAPVRWRATGFDTRIEDLITYVFPTVMNVNRARIRGMELAIEGTAWGARWMASITAQEPRDETTGLRLQGRAEHFGALHADRRFGNWSVGFSLVGSGDRYDSTNENAETRLGSYLVMDARVRYVFNKHVTVEAVATNLGDRRYETSIGYEGPRRGLLVNVRFDAF